MFVNGSDVLTVTMSNGIVRRMLGFGQQIMGCEMIFPKGASVELHSHDSHQ